ncbi:lipopolysaccharide assembly protein LapB [Lampropedia aestuarii]|uniref:Lipopolysaccharide assembly protein B n=1 Tax=Lampropedia aestuarii TaxID=2562762 RepID=A0A4S5BKG9_9BURK|nr:lipopolysaccharide assembly protein LapB [Lampropedia aestuarii]MDH5857892.1 lipopolysaccharide assembly protein LapB [Lampropedia aestuarii]THJ31355.1 lipopolysaccharide assembly protein LapB [Lampropedia aestuarii]
METEWIWLLLGLPIAFILGWLASRLDWRQMRIVQRSAPRAYFQGLTYLLNEQQDQAIDVFVQAVQSDPDTVELHFALGSLFRRRGEYDRAVRVHQHLLARADLSGLDRARAQWELAQDFMKAGLLDRAEASLQQLEGTSLESQAQTALLYIYERTHDWPQALALTSRMTGEAAQAHGAGKQMHYLCEQANDAMRQQDFERATSLLDQARACDSSGVRPGIEQVRLLLAQGQYRQAVQWALALSEQLPQTMPLLAGMWGDRVFETLQGDQALLQQVHTALRVHYENESSLDVLLALVAIEHQMGLPRAGHWYAEHIRKHPSLVAAAHWMELEQQQDAAIAKSLDKAMQPLLNYRCLHCGFEARSYFWQCPGCQSWESFPTKRVEELQA